MSHQSTMSKTGLALLKAFEGCELKAYQCQAGVWTIGYGATRGVQPGLEITEEKATQWLRRDVRFAELAVEDLCSTVPLEQHQFDALVSLVFNIGRSAFAGSTMLVCLRKRDYAGAGEQFLRWTKAGGKESAGLKRRREAERALFQGPPHAPVA